jgi:hypothetical protein
MIDLYKYINEGLLKGMDKTLASGESDVAYIKIKEWLEKYTASMHVTVNGSIDGCINSDNTLNLFSFNPWYAYSNEMEFPVPDYIDIKECDNISMTMQENVNFADLPHIGNVNELLLKPFADDLKFDLSKLPIDRIKVFEWVYDSSTIIKYPKNTDIDTFIMWQYREPYTSFGSKRFMIGFDKLKGLKCNSLAIPDIIFAENYYDFNIGSNSLIKKGSFDFDSQPGKELLKLYDDNTIQFKNLYVYSVCTSDYKFYKIKKEKNCFSVAKRGTTLM